MWQVAVVCLIVAIIALFRPIKVAMKAGMLLPEIFENSPVRPLHWVSAPARKEEFQLTYSAGEVIGDLYVPAADGPHGAVILLLGARPAPRDDPTLTRFAEGLSRAGTVVMVSESSNLSAGLVLPEEVDAVVGQVEVLRRHRAVDPDRVAIIGFSVGGSVGLLAAADERLRGKLVALNAFGAYFDAIDIARAVASRQIERDGRNEEWVPDGTTIWVMAMQIVDTLPHGDDRELVQRVFIDKDDEARTELAAAGEVARLIATILDGTEPSAVEQNLARLPAATRERLRAISPSSVASRIHAPLFVMHDLSDSLIPFTESRRLVAAVPSENVELFTEFDLFAHVTPDSAERGSSFWLEVWKLSRQVHRVLGTVL
jgi:pimeloyl-ACP methyl ester carboxylesterase